MKYGIDKYNFIFVLCAYQAFKVIKKGANVQNILIGIGYITVAAIYFKYESIIKKAIYKILPFLIFYTLLGLLFESFVETLFEQIK
ncbi:hypothetical protein [Leptotrichia sp. oral taxon 847]|uniref:hypothetical protein n=1 Tax=Leptotrichia sp. oral taxon 847 TaxID=1785996 RepID=UPI0007683487|nr:hypothetical protein [Leptotrichia sp. oral taxon 847]AMD94561.1 hypothetical protein AXF11_02415 [Leptotrichia sp. oral taxon 847]